MITWTFGFDETYPFDNTLLRQLRTVECGRVPRLVCGAGCSWREEAELCRATTVLTITSRPTERCDLQPVQTCRSHIFHVFKSIKRHFYKWAFKLDFSTCNRDACHQNLLSNILSIVKCCCHV